MSTTTSTLVPLTCVSGVEPSTDETNNATSHYTMSQNVRFFNGKPEKIGGYNKVSFDGGMSVSGVVRSIFSSVLSNITQTLIGTHTKLYSLYGSVLTNITPLQTSSVAAANSLDTHYDTLGNDPISTTDGSTTVRITDSDYSLFKVGDSLTISGATATGGIAIGILNSSHVIRNIGTGYYDIVVSTAATSTATGGGASVVRSSGLITVNKTSHGILDGERVKLEGAATTGGITDVQINIEFIVRNIQTNSFDIMTAGTATSSVSSGGGASTVYYKEIVSGGENEVFSQGYGMGQYGVGLYGTSLQSASGRALPRTWFFDKYGDAVIATAGNQTGVYTWSGSSSIAPTLVTNAPTAVNYAFISNNILVTFGAGGVFNKIFSSDQGDITNWTASSLNSVFEDNVEGAGRLLSHANVNGTNIIFTEQRCYTMRHIGRDNGVWAIKPLEYIGIMSPMSRATVGGAVFWMGNDNFYMWRGGSVEVIPSNSKQQTTLWKYVFENLNYSQKSKCFAWYNKKFGEVWFHYPSEGSNEPDRVAVVSVNDYAWWPLELDRTAAEYPEINLSVPRLSDSSSNIFRHESGYNANGLSMDWSLDFNLRKVDGKKPSTITAIIPDSVQSGNISITVTGQQWPQSTANTYSNTYTCTASQERIPVSASGRYYKYSLSGNALNQSWRMGEWYEEIQTQGAN